MYVVNTRSAENGRRLSRIRELMGKVISHGVVPEQPLEQSFEQMLQEKNDYVFVRGGTVRNPLVGTINQNVAGEDYDHHDDDSSLQKN